MINFRSNSITTKWFVWCCDHLPATVTREYGEGHKSGGDRRTGAYYVEHGTTLCHIFWAILWMPLLVMAAIALMIFMFLLMHIESYEHDSAKYGIMAAFEPEGFMLGILLLVALIFCCTIGADKIGFFKLVWLYFESIKSRVCPLVSFGTPDKKTEE